MIIAPSWQKMNRRSAACYFFCAASLMLTSCAYRFTNLYLRPPLGVRTLAIESVYDTTRAVVPHEKLWESLQKEFAADGHLYLAPREEAELYLRAHLTDAQVHATAVQGEKSRTETPERDALGNWQKPLAYRNLHKAERYSSAEELVLSVKVELWHRKEKRLLMERSYTSRGSHKTFNAKIPLESQFVTAGEGFDQLFADLSEDVAKKVVRDTLSLTTVY